MDIKGSKSISISEAKEILATRKEKGELGYEQEQALENATPISELVENSKKTLETLKSNFKLTEEAAIKVLDLASNNAQTIKAALSMYEVNVTDSDAAEMAKLFGWFTMEEYALVVEYLPLGHAEASRREPVVQLIGEKYFTLLEATTKPNMNLILGQRVYVGKEGRKEISSIKGRIGYNNLTHGAMGSLLSVLKKIIESRESFFVDFINTSKPISIRTHTLDLLPGVGKKNMEALLKEREIKPFESFADIHKRVPTLSEPSMIFAHRIINEFEGKEKYYLFTKPQLPVR